MTGQCVEICGNPCQDASYACLIELDILGGILCRGTQVDDHLLTPFQPFQPVETPSQDLDFLRHTGLYAGLRGSGFRLLPAVDGVAACPKLTEPRRDLPGLGVLEELMDTAAAQPRSGRNLSDRQPSVVGRHDGPDPFLLCLSQSCSRHTETCLKLLFVPDTLVELFTSLHNLENTRSSHACPANWTG